jgi:ATP adenylyltransferase
MRQHLLVVTRAFEEQDAALTGADFAAMWACMGAGGTLGFYNSGKTAGASQRHKHLQVVPLPLDPSGVAVPSEPLFGSPTAPGQICTAPDLPFGHALVWFDPAALVADAATPAHLLETYRTLLHACAAWDDGAPRPYNLLLTHRWMLLAPRSQERCDGIGVNGLGFAGCLLVRNDDELARLRALGPLAVLRRVGMEE